MVEIASDSGPARFVTDVFQENRQSRNDLVTRPHHIVTAAVDTTATSLAWLATAGLADVDSIVPSSAERYHRSRSTFDAVSSVPMMFAGVGLANRAVKAGALADRLSDTAVGARVANSIFADVASVARYDELMQNARSAKAIGVAGSTGLTTPNLALSGYLDEGADALRQLTGASTYEDAASWATAMTTRNALKQGVAQEVAIFGLLNQSEFLFPEEMGISGYLGFGALGVGLNIGVDVAMRRAAVRKSLANAATLGGQVASNARRNGEIFTEGQAVTGVAGERWQQVAASQYGTERADLLEQSADAIVAQGGGGLSKGQILETAREIRNSAEGNIRDNIKHMFTDRMPASILRKGAGTNPAISQTSVAKPAVVTAAAERLNENKLLNVGLAELGDANYATLIEANVQTLQTQQAKAQKALDKLDMTATPGQLAKAQGELDAINGQLADIGDVRGGVLEQHSVLNMNPQRRQPYWERADQSLMTEKQGVRHNAGRLRLTHSGAIEQVDRGRATPVKMTDLGFADVTELHTMIGRASGTSKFTNQFWNQFLNTDTLLQDLPFPVLDALRDGVLKMPEGLLPPKAGQIRAALQDGTINNMALAQKLEWWKANRKQHELGEAAMDLQDAEKALNLRLVDDRGFPNALGHAVQAYADHKGTATAADMLLSDGRANVGLDSLFELGTGAAGATTAQARAAMDTNWAESIRGVKAATAHEKPKAIGALYHNIKVPTDGELATARIAAARNSTRREVLLDGQSEYVNEISRAMMTDSVAYAGARDTVSLFHDVKVTNNTFTTTTFAHRFQKALQHAAQVQKDASNAANRQVDDMLRPVGEFFRALQRKPNWVETAPQIAGAQQLIHRGFALADDGWQPGYNKIDISRPGAKRTLDELGELKGAPKEQDDWLLFDITVAANEGLYIPLKLGDDAARALDEMTNIGAQQLDAMNALRRASGMHAIERLKGHQPVANFNRFKMRYIEDPDTGQVIGYVKGRTDKEADTALAIAMEGMNKRRGGGTPVHEITTNEIKSHYDAMDEVFLHNLRDFSGVKQSGTSGGRSADYRLDVSADLLGDAMVAMRNSFEDLNRRVVAANFAEPLSEARMMLSRIGSDANSGRYFNAVQQWENVLLGTDKLADDSFAKRGHSYVEDLANFGVGKFVDSAAAVWRITGFGRNGKSPKQAAFEKAVMDAHEPFTHLSQPGLVENFLNAGEAVDPYRAAKVLQMANRATTFVALKLANVAHPILNYTGAVVTMPGVLKGMQKGADETVAEWQARVGPVADYLDGEGTMTINAAKLMTEGMEMVFKDPAAVEYAARRGFIEANMLEELNKVTSFKPSKFMDAMEGVGKYADFINSWLTPLQKKITGKEPSAQTLSERSESGTRAWIHMTGYALAKRSGQNLSEAQLHSFAHYFANQNIADFSPNLRGEAFRGLGGIPFGLFQSYSINLYQRLFRYVEDGNKRALAVQMATQASMFGVAGMPGWNALNASYFNTKDSKANGDGATTLNERIYNSLGKDTADILMAGGLSNLPRLAGGGEAVNLFSSGDANPRAPNSPALSVGTQVLQGMREGIKVAKEEIPKVFTAENFDSGRFAEVLANYAPSRGHRALVDLALGERVDRRGNLVEDDTRSGVSLVARLLGTKTRDEVMVSEAIWNNGQAQRQRIEDMSRVRNQMLRHIRDETMTDEQLTFFLQDYITAGGDSQQWARWVKFTEEKATQSRDERALDRIVKATGEIMPHNFPAVQRLVAAGAKNLPEFEGQQAPTLP